MNEHEDINEYEELLLAKNNESEIVQDNGVLKEVIEAIKASIPTHTLPSTQHIIGIPGIGALQYERATKDWLYNSSKFSKEAYLYVDKRKLERLFSSGNIALFSDEFLENVAKGENFGNFIKVPMVCEQRMFHRRSGEQYNGKRVPTLARVRFGFPGVVYNEKHKPFIHTYFKNDTKYSADDLVGITIGEFKGRNDGIGFRQFSGLPEVEDKNCGFGKFKKGEKQKDVKVFAENKHNIGKRFYCNETYYIDPNDANNPGAKLGRRVMYTQLQQNFDLTGTGTGAENAIKGDNLFKTADGNDFTINIQGEYNKVITKQISKDVDLADIDINVPVSGANLPEKFVVTGGGAVEEYFKINNNKKIVTRKNDLTGKKGFYVMDSNSAGENILSVPNGTAQVIQEIDQGSNELTYCDFLFGDKFIRLKVGKKANPASGGVPPDVPRKYADVKDELNHVAQALYSGDMDYFAKIKKDQNNKCVFEDVEIKFPDGNEIKIDLKGANPKKQFGNNGVFSPESSVGESKSFYDDFNTQRELWNTTNITLDDLEDMALELAE